MKHKITLILSLALLCNTAFAQRGIPPREKTRTPHITKYAQHLDFIPQMVKLLNVPEGWKVDIAASGLGRPRMLYQGANGSLYATRRDAGDVLLLRDANGDNVFEDLVTAVADFKGVHAITMKDGFNVPGKQ